MTLKKYIPDAITCCNLLCGSAGVVFALDGRVDIAFFLKHFGNELPKIGWCARRSFCQKCSDGGKMRRPDIKKYPSKIKTATSN